MMSDLDKKLHALLVDGGIEDEPDVKTSDYVVLIKQAFIDDGWSDPDSDSYDSLERAEKAGM